MTERTRAEHVRWCKARARECLDRGDADGARNSMMSDLRKHEETRGLIDGGGIGAMLGLAAAMFGDPLTEARRYVEGFAE